MSLALISYHSIPPPPALWGTCNKSIISSQHCLMNTILEVPTSHRTFRAKGENYLSLQGNGSFILGVVEHLSESQMLLDSRNLEVK